ncbi:MAG: hypothetical protein RL380_854 [Verrucomicrobiota bacterium]
MKKIQSLALAGLFLTTLALTAHAQFATTVVSYSPGTGASAGYTNDTSVATGAPSEVNPYFDNTDPFDPPYGTDQIVSIGAGGSLTLRFAAPVANNASNAFGLDFIVFGNSGFIITNDYDFMLWDWVGTPATDGSLFANNTGLSRVSVSADGTNFFLLNTNVAPQVDDLFPPDGTGNAQLPVNPALTGDSFAGATLAGIRSLYAGSGGGAGFDIAWAQDTNGNPVSLASVSYVRIEVISGKVEVDALASVAPLITTQPTSVTTTNPVASATFSVVAANDSAVTYQWFYNGVASAGATNAALTTANAGNYFVVVTSASGAVTSRTVTFTKPVPMAAYYGLFYETNAVNFGSSGYFNFSVASARTRTFNGKILIEGGSYMFTGTFASNHQASATVARPGKTSLIVSLQLLAAADQVIGSVTDGTWTAPLLGDRATFNATNVAPQLGNYTFTLLGDSNGNDAPSYGSQGKVTVRTNGAVMLSGSLSDAAPLTQSTYLSKNGQWPLYAPLYTGKGALLGWVTFTNQPTLKLTGDVSWIKTNASGLYYSSGFTNPVTLFGGRRH